MVANLPDNPLDFIVQVLATMFGILFNAGSITQPFVQNAVNHAWAAHQDNPLSPEYAAVAVLKGWMTPEAGATEAGMGGVDGSRFQTMVDTEGNPLPVEAGMEAVRRGLMDETRFIKLLQESRYRVEWADLFIALQTRRPDLGAAVHGAVTGHLTQAAYQELAHVAGIAPADAQWLFDAAGRPPGIQQAIQLWRRNVMTEADVRTVVAESDVKVKYTDAILELRRAIPPLFQINRLLTAKAITAAQATTWILEDGYDQSVADGMVGAAGTATVGKHKDLAEGMIVRAYKVDTITRADAANHLVAIGYDATEAEFLLAVEDTLKAEDGESVAISRIRTLYVAHKIDKPTAQGQLDNIPIPSGQRDHLLHLWDIERSVTISELTPTQMGAAVKKGLLQPADMHTRLVQRGYSDADATILVGLYG